MIRLPPGVSAFAAYADVAPVLLDKLRFHDLCLRHGVDTPRVWRVEGRDGLAALAESLPFPCILKPLLIHRAKHVLNGQKVLREGMQPVFASVIGYVTGIAVHWTITSRAVFADETAARGTAARHKQKVLFAGSALAGLALTTAIVGGGAHLGLDPRVAKLIAIIVSFQTTYILRRRIVFTEPADE